MAELGAAAIGAGATIGATLYTTASRFIARHESTHSLQVTEIRHHIADFEAAYAQGEVAEDDWHTYLAIRDEARTTESDYEDSIETYKRTPVYNFVVKWKKRRQVRKKKRALRMANRSLRSHYYESTSSASDASSITAESGSPPQSRRSPAHSDEDDNKWISSWAEGVYLLKAQSDSDQDQDEGFTDPLSALNIFQTSISDTRRPSKEAGSPPQRCHSAAHRDKDDKQFLSWEESVRKSPDLDLGYLKLVPNELNTPVPLFFLELAKTPVQPVLSTFKPVRNENHKIPGPPLSLSKTSV